MNTHTTYLTFNTEKRQEIIDITEEVEKCRAAAGVTEGMVELGKVGKSGFN